MPKAYAVVCYHSISDPKKLAAYAKLAPARLLPSCAGSPARRRPNPPSRIRSTTGLNCLSSPEMAGSTFALLSEHPQLGLCAVRDFRNVEGLE